MVSAARRRKAILGYWRAVEHFEPATVTVPKRGTRMKTGSGWCHWVELDPRSGSLPLLPWDLRHGLRSEPIDPERQQWRHTVYCGVFRLDRVHGYFVERYGGDQDHGGARERYAAVCGFVVDQHGRLIDDTTAFSSCAWAAGRLSRHSPRPGWLDGWSEAVSTCSAAVGLLARTHVSYPRPGGGAPGGEWQRLIRDILGEAAEGAVLALVGGLTGPVGAVATGAAQGAVRTVSRAVRDRAAPGGIADRDSDQQSERPARELRLLDLVAFTAHVAARFGVPEDLVPRDRAPLVVESELLTRRRGGTWRAASAPFLDSFLVEDLQRVERERHGPALVRYLDEAGPDRAARIDVRAAPERVREAVLPEAFPAGCWPADTNKPLVVSQQLAVNQITTELMDRPGLFSVNGPPGTGKTTMLRDLIAAIVVERARRLAALRKPADGFGGKPIDWRHEGRDRRAYRPREKLTGFEIVVASSNNGAVENLTVELPDAGAVGAQWRRAASYFADQARALLGDSAWGAVAAPLGKRDNRSAFVQNFWWGREQPDGRVGLHSLLRRAEERGATGSWAAAIDRFRVACRAEQKLRRTVGRWDAPPGDEPELVAPFHDREWMSARVRVFLAALDLHRDFVMHTAGTVRTNLLALWKTLDGLPDAPPPEAELAAWRTLFLLVPVVSTTFASCGWMFASLGAESLGWLLVDEAGQAAPQAAVGALWRAQRAVLVGDPLQLEPIVQLPESIQASLCGLYGVSPQWLPGATSAQGLADLVNRWGTFVERRTRDGAPEPAWVGAPLRAHRRCEETIFRISNAVAYDGMMVYGTSEVEFPSERSRWVDVGEGNGDTKWVPEEGKALAQVLEKLQYVHRVPLGQIRVLSPFRDVMAGCRRAVRARQWERRPPPDGDEKVYRQQVDVFVRDQIGTVHTMQGKESDVVVLVLGASGRRLEGSRRWAARRPNLLNVAVSRDRRRLYVIGSHRAWAGLPYFQVLARELGEPWPWEGERQPPYSWRVLNRHGG